MYPEGCRLPRQQAAMRLQRRGDPAALARHVLLAGGDPYFHFADMESYLQMQKAVDSLYLDKAGWGKKALLNISGMGYFSSDRTIAEYAKEIWHIKPYQE